MKKAIIVFAVLVASYNRSFANAPVLSILAPYSKIPSFPRCDDDSMMFRGFLNFLYNIGDSATLSGADPDDVLLALKGYAYSQSWGTLDTNGVAHYVNDYWPNTLANQLTLLKNESIISNDLYSYLDGLFTNILSNGESTSYDDIQTLLASEDGNIEHTSMSESDKAKAHCIVLLLKKFLDMYQNNPELKSCGFWCWLTSAVAGVIGYIFGGGGVVGVGMGVLGFFFVKCCVWDACPRWDPHCGIHFTLM